MIVPRNTRSNPHMYAFRPFTRYTVHLAQGRTLPIGTANVLHKQFLKEGLSPSLVQASDCPLYRILLTEHRLWSTFLCHASNNEGLHTSYNIAMEYLRNYQQQSYHKASEDPPYYPCNVLAPFHPHCLTSL